MSVKHMLFWAGMIGMGAWLLTLLRHEESVRAIMRSQGLVYGLDWTWANPSEYGANPIFSTPAVKSVRTGEIVVGPLMGVGK